jgi:CheY-like chemotaxis protein
MPHVVPFPSAAGAPAGSKLWRILIVDPDPDTRYLYKAALEPLGAVIAEAEDGAEALGKAFCDPPAVIVTETTLPRLDGLALCASVRRNPVTAHVHIVVATASVSSRSLAVAAGADEVLVKPYALEELIGAVRGVLRQANPGEIPRRDDHARD